MNGDLKPVIVSQRGKASAAANFPFHNWYSFVLGYTPEFPDYILDREGVSKEQLVVDPFLGSGTTVVCCKKRGIPSMGLEANDFFAFAARVKSDWTVDPLTLRKMQSRILNNLEKEFGRYGLSCAKCSHQASNLETNRLRLTEYVRENRPTLLLEKYISDAPCAGLLLIKNELDRVRWPTRQLEAFFRLAFSSTVLPASNVRYGPGFGVVKPRVGVDVLAIFSSRLERMISDLESIRNSDSRGTESRVQLGDARQLTQYLRPDSVDLMITSPPYPGDHEYTKYSKLELILNGFADSMGQFKTIKQRMVRGSTTNIYRDDREGDAVRDVKSIQDIVREIDRRLNTDGATSGFEKLYTKLIWEYFGGMYRTFQETWTVLKPEAKFALLVSDSHAFKMVHIKTAELLKEVAEKAGFVNCQIELWQYKTSTSHKYKLLENILTIQKPAHRL